MLNLNIDSKLCGCHVVTLKVEDVASHSATVDRAMVGETKPDISPNWNERAVVTP
jgi:hypothetical protein